MDRTLTITTPPAGTTPASSERSGLERQKVAQLAQEFESMMMLQLLRQMRQTMLDEDEGGLSADTMNDTVNTELARQLSRSGGIGIASAITKGLERQIGNATAVDQVDRPASTPADLAVAPAAPYLHNHGAAMPLTAKGVALTSPYGWRADPFTGVQKYHQGVDLGAAYGTSVPAAAGGRVVAVGDLGAYGTQVLIEHENGLQTRYAHLSAVNVGVGDRVTQGQEIGRVGQSGRATGPHLHFEVIQNGQRVDPTGIMALGGSGLGGLKLLGSDADFSVGGRVSPSSTTGADDENRGH